MFLVADKESGDLKDSEFDLDVISRVVKDNENRAKKIKKRCEKGKCKKAKRGKRRRSKKRKNKRKKAKRKRKSKNKKKKN